MMNSGPRSSAEEGEPRSLRLKRVESIYPQVRSIYLQAARLRTALMLNIRRRGRVGTALLRVGATLLGATPACLLDVGATPLLEATPPLEATPQTPTAPVQASDQVQARRRATQRGSRLQ